MLLFDTLHRLYIPNFRAVFAILGEIERSKNYDEKSNFHFSRFRMQYMIG